MNSMGDLASPRRDVAVDRLRERFKGYQNRHSEAAYRYHRTAPVAHENQRQETLMLSQKTQENKAKKAGKSSARINRDPSNQQIQQVILNKRVYDVLLCILWLTPNSLGLSLSNIYACMHGLALNICDVLHTYLPCLFGLFLIYFLLKHCRKVYVICPRVPYIVKGFIHDMRIYHVH